MKMRDAKIAYKIWYRIYMQFLVEWRWWFLVGFTTCNLYRGQMNHCMPFMKQLFATYYSSLTTIKQHKGEMKKKIWQKKKPVRVAVMLIDQMMHSQKKNREKYLHIGRRIPNKIF